jgi:signal transduction histidine kinase
MLNVADQSITWRLTRMNLMVSAASLLVACAAFMAFDAMSFRRSLVGHLSIEAQIIGSNSIAALLFDDPAAARKTLSALQAASHVRCIAIFRPDGLQFAAYGSPACSPDRMSSAPAAGQTEGYWFGKDRVELIHAIVFQGQPTGLVYLQSDLGELSERQGFFARAAGGVLLASLLAALLVSFAFRRTVADPIVRLAATARAVSRGEDYSVRAASTGRRDEVAVLIDAFNEMLQKIQERDAALQKARDLLEQRVEERTAQLTAANKELEAFSYSVSHDLRAPLRSIDGFSQALLEDSAPMLDEQGKAHLQRIRAASQRMGVLIDDLLNLARVTRAEMHREPVDLSALAAVLADELRKREPVRQAEVLIEPGLETRADPRLVRVALENLLSNAWKFSSKHPAPRIEFGQALVNGAAAFFVRDNGAGFDPAYAGRLFGAFQRLHAATEFPGTGVGLATVQRIIHRHGGTVWAESAVGRGATFYFTL